MKLIDPSLHEECLKDIVSTANKYVIFMSPYWCKEGKEYDIKIFDEVFEDALRRGVKILLLCKGTQINYLRDHYTDFYNKYDRRCSVFVLGSKRDFFWDCFDYFDLQDEGIDFHIKVYMNENKALITSRNISGFKTESIDLGVLVSGCKIMKDLKKFLKDLIIKTDSNYYMQKFLEE